MSSHFSAAVLSVGDELVLGQTLDTNSRWISQRLRDAGIMPVEHVTVPDDLARHVAALKRLAEEHQLVISSGGLGPTADDLTRQALAEAAGDTLVEDALALEDVRAFYASRGREMPALNRVQALRPSRGQSLPNLHGTAPGLFARVGACDVICLPGPPGELKPMFESQVTPRLRPPPGRTVATRALHCFGIGESDLATRLGPLMARGGELLVGTTASGGVVSCRLRYEGPLPRAMAEQELDRVEGELRAKADAYIFGDGDETLASAVVHRLASKGETLGTVESCTAGGLSSMVADVPGASSVLLGGLVTYSNALKSLLAGVSADLITVHGAVSGPIARAMAEGGVAALGVQHCLGITGIAGPTGGTPGKPVGTVYIARAERGASTEIRRFAFSGDRQAIREWSAKSGLAMLRMHLDGIRHVRLLRQHDEEPLRA